MVVKKKGCEEILCLVCVHKGERQRFKTDASDEEGLIQNVLFWGIKTSLVVPLVYFQPRDACYVNICAR